MKISSEDFRNIAIECNLDLPRIVSTIRQRYPDMENRPNKIQTRLERFRKKGLLPLDSGNSVSVGEILKGTSTLYSATGEIKQQWVKTDVAKEQILSLFRDAVEAIIEDVPQVSPSTPPPITSNMDSLMSVYTIGDAHVGMLAWAPESGEDNDLTIVQSDLYTAMDLLVQQSNPTNEAFIIDVGDYFHSDNAENRTAKSGNTLDVDGRYARVLEVGLRLTTRLIDRALTKHQTVRWRSAIGELIAT
jgi:hypothetical protein